MLKSENLLLQTARLELRPVEQGDAQRLGWILRNPKVCWWRWGKPPYSKADMQMLVCRSRRLNKKGLGWWLVREKKTGALAGDVVLQYFHGGQEIELGYHFLPGQQCKGYCTEAANALLQYAFLTIEAPRIMAVVLPNNRPSQRIMQKLNFTQRGECLHAGLIHRYFRLDREDYLRHVSAFPTGRNQQS